MHGLMAPIVKSAATWPVTTLWVAGTATIFSVAEGWLRWPMGLLAFLVISAGILVCSALRDMSHELTEIHRIVNGHRDALVARTQILERALRDAEVPIPNEGREEARLK